MDRREQKPQVLGDNGHIAQGPPQGFEKVDARAFQPLAVDGGFLPVGDGVIGVEGPEMVDAGHVEQPPGHVDPVHPPVIFCPFQKFPVVKGVPPKLAGF